MSWHKIFWRSTKVSMGVGPSPHPFRFISPGAWKSQVPPRYRMTVLLLSLSLSLNVGCGAVGKPIPPEDVGIEAKKRKQERETGGEQDKTGIEEPLPATEQPEELPPFYPIGGR
ncbi:MAG: hypothetical protein AB7P17_04795 [Nitrospirales bacterium]|nr:hypothetical protein [Nitrospirales bacterium]